MGSSETTISGPKTCQAILKIQLQKKSTNTKIVGIEIMKPSYLMELFCYLTFLGYRETFLDLKWLFLMIPLYLLDAVGSRQIILPKQDLERAY